MSVSWVWVCVSGNLDIFPLSGCCPIEECARLGEGTGLDFSPHVTVDQMSSYRVNLHNARRQPWELSALKSLHETASVDLRKKSTSSLLQCQQCLSTRVLFSNLYITTTLTFEVGIEPRTAEYRFFSYLFFGMRTLLRQTLILTSCYTCLLSICSFHSEASLPADIVLNASSSSLLSAVACGLGASPAHILLGERNGCHSMV